MSDTVVLALVNEAMTGIEDARLALLRAGSALDRLGVDRKLHADVLLTMDEMRDFAARLTELVDFDGDDR
jgi:phosphoglucomutase